jgi:glycosyltransferase involved in cell wall biosynthesis
MTEPAIDLIVSTIGRASELGSLLASLEAQSYRRFRVIVVDQNDDDRLEHVLAPYEQSLLIVRLRSGTGLNRGRNEGLRHADGDIVAFPDDDCWYPADLLQHVVERFREHPEWDGLTVRTTDSAGRPSSMRWDRTAGPIDRFSVWRRAQSIGIFLRSPVVEAVGEFVEDLGPGTGWASGDETDYLLRALRAGFVLYYDPSLSVHHEWPEVRFDRASARRAYRYGLGNGRVLRTHRYPWWFVAYRIAQLTAGAAMFLMTARPAQARYYFVMALGRARGWLASGNRTAY